MCWKSRAKLARIFAQKMPVCLSRVLLWLIQTRLMLAAKTPGKCGKHWSYIENGRVSKSQISNLKSSFRHQEKCAQHPRHFRTHSSQIVKDHAGFSPARIETIVHNTKCPASPRKGGRTAILPTAVRTTPWSRRVVYGFLKSGRNRFRQPNLDPPRGDQIRTRIDPPSPRSAVESR